ncbi:anti sigma factor C-terminal domain-containing protein [Neobacillus niacini]|uniref:anti sigma factor C-terminal domain-containing protein n=1 Tax=Neobacillus niacini TaxID=86668 RepID=UPI002FFDC6B9
MTKPNDDELELDSVFEMDDNTFQDAVKKAKKKIANRNIIISVLVSLGVLIILIVGWLSLMGLSQAVAIQDERMYSQIKSPNVYEIGYQIKGNGLFEGTLSFTRYKMVGDFPIDWNDDVINYNLFGRSGRVLGDHSPVQTTDKIDGLPRFYDRDVKERIMQFYHPNVDYKTIRNDIIQLKNVGTNKEIEMAISFDKGYSPKEVRNFLPSEVSLTWYWVDTYSDSDKRLEDHSLKQENGNIINFGSDPLFADEVYGFSEENIEGISSEEAFLRDIKEGKAEVSKKEYSQEFERIYDHLRGSSKEPKVSDMKIIGVIVTGSSPQLNSLQNIKQIRSSVFGAIAEKDY